jgi:chromosome segregation ATPase
MTRPSPWRATRKLVPLCAPLLLAGCEGSSRPPASPPPPAASAAEPHDAGAGETQGETKERDDLKADLAAVDVSLTDLNKRLEIARDAVKADLQQQVAALQKRDEALKAHLKTIETRADAEAEKARRDIHRAIMDLKSDMRHIADRVHH